MDRVMKYISSSRHIYSVTANKRAFVGKSVKVFYPESDIKLNPLVEVDSKYAYNGYTVEIGDRKVITITTSCPFAASKWLKEVLKAGNTRNGALIVGLSVDEPEQVCTETMKIVQICSSSSCLILRLPLKEEYGYKCDPVMPLIKRLREFFERDDVYVVAAPPVDDDSGSGLKSVRILKEEYGIEISNTLVVNSSLLSQKAKQIGIRNTPEKEEPWYVDRWWPRWHHRYSDWPVQFQDDEILTDNRVELCTFRTYLCFLIGNENLDLQLFPATSAKKKRNRKKKKKNK